MWFPQLKFYITIKLNPQHLILGCSVILELQHLNCSMDKTFLEGSRSVVDASRYRGTIKSSQIPLPHHKATLRFAVRSETFLVHSRMSYTFMILVKNQRDVQFFCMFISILYIFRVAMCPSSGELLYQCDTWFVSPCEDDRLVCSMLPQHPISTTRLISDYF